MIFYQVMHIEKHPARVFARFASIKTSNHFTVYGVAKHCKDLTQVAPVSLLEQQLST